MKNLQYQKLLDVYGKLLTKTQMEVCFLYFMCDLSLTEIAEQKAVSKQSISAMLASCKQLLDTYEQKLAILHWQEKVLNALQILQKECPTCANKIQKAIDLVKVIE